MRFRTSLPIWTILAPIVAWTAFSLKELSHYSFIIAFMIAALIAAVIAAVHHAEVVAHKVGEPFGTIILALAVTVIELSLILTLMTAGDSQSLTLARDTIFAANMILLTGIVGLCLMIGAAKFHEQFIVKHSATSALITLTSILVLTLVLPNYTTTTPGPDYNNSQLIFVAITCLILYGAFITVQSVRHRDYFLPIDKDGEEVDKDGDGHADPPTIKTTLTALLLLLACLVAVVLLAKTLSPTIESGVASIGAPNSLVGIIIAMVILLPESIAAIQNARRDRLQVSMNLALGSALASTGLTIPAVAIFSVFYDSSVVLGIDAKSTVLLVLSIFTVMLSLITGKTNVLYGIVLLVIFATYLFTTIVP
jgi:Ca2+:H+ antiporter